MNAAVKDVDAYIASAPDTDRASLEKLRKLIKSAAPDAEEVISFQVPTYKQSGFLVSFGVAKDHCSFYTVSEALMQAMKDEVKPYLSGKTTLHFTPESPLPEALVTKIVKARVKENEAKKKAKKTRNL
ncbi:MAG: DUF1801 domain-containing protein [Chlorobia bacterium]|nr:DUF1801 domain-containing protein [Fimbriimonadaceae bacterium]